MGLLSKLGGKIWDGMKNLGEEAQGYYREGMEMDEERLIEKLERAKRYKRFAELAGYNKAAKERGLV